MQSEHDGECLFCSIAKTDTDDEKKRVLYRGKYHYVIINAYPYSNGHVMVVCNRHIEHFSDLDAEESAELTRLISKCEKALLGS